MLRMNIFKIIVALAALLLLCSCSSTNEKGVSISKGLFADAPALTSVSDA